MLYFASRGVNIYLYKALLWEIMIRVKNGFCALSKICEAL